MVIIEKIVTLIVALTLLIPGVLLNGCAVTSSLSYAASASHTSASGYSLAEECMLKSCSTGGASDKVATACLTDQKEQKIAASSDSRECKVVPSALFTTFELWKTAVNLLPPLKETSVVGKDGKIDYTKITTAPELTEEVFNAALDEYSIRESLSSLRSSDAWLDGKIPTPSFYRVDSAAKKDIYVQKVCIPEGNTLVILGDLHGGVHGMLEVIARYVDGDNGFKLKDPKVYIVFLGDYADRGVYGYECIYTLLRLKNANAGRIFLIRGNHEEEAMSSRYGFAEELRNKKVSTKSQQRIYSWYGLMPAALFVVSNILGVQLCHGGIESTYDPKTLLNTAASIQFQRLPNLTKMNGFMWSDFRVDQCQRSAEQKGRGKMYSAQDTYAYLHKASSGSVTLAMIIRAHQHTGSMMNRILGRDGMNEDNHGAAKLWNLKARTENTVWPFSVITLNVAHDTVVGIQNKFDYDTHALLALAKNFRDWTLRVRRQRMHKES